MNRFSWSFLSTKFFFISLGVGSIALFIGMAISVGSIQDAVTMLTILTVCTLGIGLAIWLGIASLIGMVIVGSIWGLMRVTGVMTPTNITSSEADAGGEGTSQPRLSGEELALVEYTIKAKDRGLSDTQIATRLQAQGWNNAEIEMAQGLANVNQRRRFGEEEP